MSIKAMTLVWEHSKQSGSALLMLLAIADYAKDDGTGAWPSIATLARKTRMTRRNAIYVIKKLEEEGELRIIRDEADHKSNVYDIVFPVKVLVKPTSPPSETLFTTPVKPTSPPSETLFTTPVKPTSPPVVKPTSPDPLVEPLENHYESVTRESENPSPPKNPTPQEVYANPEVSERAKALLKKLEAEKKA